MPPLPQPPRPPTPRLIMYYQTHHNPLGIPISITPLVNRTQISITHLILAALHLNAPPASSPHSTPPSLSLNDHPPSHPRNSTLWAELHLLRASGVKVLALLGGAAKGTYALLDTASISPNAFERNYSVLAAFVRERALDGLDLDVEEDMSLQGIIHLIDRLKADFGAQFIVSLAPVAAALLVDEPEANLSGFSYHALEVLRGSSIAWYNTQFYCGWGDMHSEAMYEGILARGWPVEKVVVGLVTSAQNGKGFVPLVIVGWVLGRLRRRYGDAFGGVMGWEYFNGEPGGEARPWEWAAFMTGVLGRGQQAAAAVGLGGVMPVDDAVALKDESALKLVDAEEDSREEASLPKSFEYFTDEDLDG